MSRTYKDRKDNQVVQFAKSKRQAQPLKQKYIRFKQCGYETSSAENNDENLDGNLCPNCGAPTHFESYFLTCAHCGWIDAADESIDLKMRAFDIRADDLGECDSMLNSAESNPDADDDSTSDSDDRPGAEDAA